MFNEIINVLKGNEIEEIYFTGCFDSEDNDFVINANYIYFELGSQYICFEAIESYSKLKIYITPTILDRNEVEDMIDGKVKISELIFTNPLSSNRKIISVSFVNLEKNETNIICEVLCFELVNGEFIFLDPSFLGIKAGGKQQQEFWENNIGSGKTILEERIDL